MDEEELLMLAPMTKCRRSNDGARIDHCRRHNSAALSAPDMSTMDAFLEDRLPMEEDSFGYMTKNTYSTIPRGQHFEADSDDDIEHERSSWHHSVDVSQFNTLDNLFMDTPAPTNEDTDRIIATNKPYLMPIRTETSSKKSVTTRGTLSSDLSDEDSDADDAGVIYRVIRTSRKSFRNNKKTSHMPVRYRSGSRSNSSSTGGYDGSMRQGDSVVAASRRIPTLRPGSILASTLSHAYISAAGYVPTHSPIIATRTTPATSTATCRHVTHPHDGITTHHCAAHSISNNTVSANVVSLSRAESGGSLAKPNGTLMENDNAKLAHVAELTDEETQDKYAIEAQRYAESLPTVPTPPGVVTPLMKHQSQALWWLLNRAYGYDDTHPCALLPLATRELSPVTDGGNGPDTVPGVILGDDMGLGKTLVTLTFIIDRLQRRDKHAVQTPALLVCPTSTISNWVDQAKQHTPNMRVHVCNRDNGDYAQLLDHDLIVVTYDYVRMAFGRSFAKTQKSEFPHRGAGKSAASATTGAYKPLPIRERDPLYQIMWHCIILDEAHRIKNVKTKLATSCRHLVGTDDVFRMCVSGTPVQNSSDELMSLVQFIRATLPSNVGASATHRAIYQHGDAMSTKPAIYQLLDRIMLRRKKDSRLDGAPIVALPEVSHEVVGLVATPMQQLLQHAVVDYVRRQVKQTMAASAAGAATKTTTTMSAASEPKIDRREYYTCLLGALRRMQQVADHGVLPFHTLSKDTRTLDELLYVTRKAVASLPHDISSQHSTSSSNDDGRSVASPLQHEATGVGAGGHSPSVQTTMASLVPVNNTDMSIFGITVAQLLDCQMAKEHKTTKSSRVDLTTCDPEKYTDLSNKATYLVNESRRILQEDPTSKIVIFSQFVQFLHLLNAALRSKLPDTIRVVQLDGSLTQKHRESIIHDFQTDASTRIFLGSLKAGGEGLNLTAANWIFIADPWWNPAADKQALERVYRIGQSRKTWMRTLFTLYSVEQKILVLQDKKRQIAKALQRDKGASYDESVKNDGKLTQHELEDLVGIHPQ